MRNIWNLFSFILVTALIFSITALSSCTTTPTTATSSSRENTFLELLNYLPESAKDAEGFIIIDYKSMWRENGIFPYSVDGNKIPPKDFLNTVIELVLHDPFSSGVDFFFSSGSYLTGWGSEMIFSPIQVKYIGYDFSDVNAEIHLYNIQSEIDPGATQISSFKPDFLLAATGKYNPLATENALKNQSDWPLWAVGAYTTEQYRGITIHSWGDGTLEHQDIIVPPNLDNIGRARPIAVSNGELFAGNSVQDIKSMIDASQKISSSLADIPEYALVAKGMYDLGAYGAIFSDESHIN